MWNPFKRKQHSATIYQLGDLVECTVRDLVDGQVEIYYGSVSLEIVLDDVSKGSLYYTTLQQAAAQSPQKFLKLIKNKLKV